MGEQPRTVPPSNAVTEASPVSPLRGPSTETPGKTRLTNSHKKQVRVLSQGGVGSRRAQELLG